MTYEDPRTGQERNLGQEEAGSSMGSWLAGIIFLAAVLLGGWYFFNHNQKVADVNQPAPSTAANTSSGPGVQGSEGGTNGPSAQPGSSSTGASSGTSGSTTQPGNNGADANTTQPAQDSAGVKGAEGSKNGPAANTPPSSNTPANNPAPAPSTNP